MANSVIVKIDGDDSGFKSAMSGIGNVAKKSLGLAVKGAAAATAGIAALTTMSVKGYAEYEQLVGGVETLFKDSAGAIKGYADEAYKTAGLSANEYMSTVTSFSASLLQSLNGDTAKSAEYANQAIIDMSDNANKMGTSMEAIQNAYQGFAKQNYTMLDNLKLGYGGTKEEMQRLLDDASKISGIKYDISSFADVTEAIHVMQMDLQISGYSAEELQSKLLTMSLSADEVKRIAQDMGISYEEAMAKMNSGTLTVKDAQVLLGTTAKEASTTIQGSASAMGAAWENLLVGMSDPTQNFEVLLQNFISSVTTFASNLLPVVTTAAQGVLQMVQGLLPQIPTLFQEMLPVVIEGVSGILTGVVEVLPQIVDTIMEVLPQITTAVLNMLPQILEAGIQILLSLIQGLTEAIPQLIDMLPEIIDTLVTTLIDNLPLIIEAGIELLIALVEGLTEAIPQLIDYLPTIIETLVTTLIDNLPMIIECAVQLLVALINGLVQALPQLIAMTPQIIMTIVETLINNLPQLLAAGETLLTSIIDGIGSVLSNLSDVGRDIVEGIKEGIKKAWENLKEWFSGLFDDLIAVAKKILGIKSPSRVMRDEVGKMITKGIAVGIDEGKTEVQKVMESLNKELLESEKKYLDESERLKNSKSEADKKYLAELKENADRERKIYDALQKDIENYKQGIVDNFKEMSEQAIESIEDLAKAQDKLSGKLSDFGGLTDEIKIEGTDYSYHTLTNLDSEIAVLENYRRLLKEVQALDDGSEGFDILYDEILSMDRQDAINTMSAVVNEKDLPGFLAKLSKKAELSAEIAKEAYREDFEELKTNIENTFGTVPEEFFDIGEDSAKQFGDGFMEQLKATFEEVRAAITTNLATITPNVAYAGGYGGTTNNYSATYNIQPSQGESTQAQLKAVEDYETLNKARGGY